MALGVPASLTSSSGGNGTPSSTLSAETIPWPPVALPTAELRLDSFCQLTEVLHHLVKAHNPTDQAADRQAFDLALVLEHPELARHSINLERHLPDLAIG